MNKTAIAKDYYKTQLSLKHIVKKHGVQITQVRNISKNICENSIEEKDYLIIKIERKNINNAMRVLNAHYIKYEVPESFELTEKFESKMNG